MNHNGVSTTGKRECNRFPQTFGATGNNSNFLHSRILPDLTTMVRINYSNTVKNLVVILTLLVIILLGMAAYFIFQNQRLTDKLTNQATSPLPSASLESSPSQLLSPTPTPSPALDRKSTRLNSSH